MNKKYYPSAFILYLNYFIHGIGCSILGQAVIKEMLVAQWGQGMDAIGQVTMVAAALGLGRLISCRLQDRCLIKWEESFPP